MEAIDTMSDRACVFQQVPYSNTQENTVTTNQKVKNSSTL